MSKQAEIGICLDVYLKKNRKHWTTAWECYFCSNCFWTKEMFGAHIKNCVGQPIIAYNFDTKNLVTFEDYLR